MTTLRPWQRAAQWLLLGIGAAGVIPVLFRPITVEIGYTLAGLSFAFVGWILTQRRPDNGIGWTFLGAWCLDGLFNLSGAAEAHAVATDNVTAWWSWLGAWLTGWMFGPLVLLATTLPMLLFPEGFVSRRWRWVAIVGAGAAVVTVVVEMISPVVGVFGSASQAKPTLINNPLSPSFLAGAGLADGWPVRNLALAVVCATAAVAGVGLFIRARRASEIERLQFRWVGFAAVVMAALFSLSALPTFSDTHSIGVLLWSVALAILPLSMAVAILRFHLYDIDRVISRTTSYAIVTGCLLLTYTGIVTLASRVLHTESALVVAAATLAAAALARPILRRVQDVVDRRFNRSRYDAQHTVDAFGARLRHATQPELVQSDLVAAVDQAIQPTSVTLWVRP